MRRLALVVLLAGCASSVTPGAGALCSAVENGRSPQRMYEAESDGRTAREFAIYAHDAMSRGCPEELETNVEWREWLVVRGEE